MSLPTPSTAPLEAWGGVECSFVRLARGHEDQLVRTGHYRRLDDLDRLWELGLRTLRYPILWEHHAGNPIDWSWADARMARLCELGIRPIVGLLHHGCGPLAGGFLDHGFVAGLARFAGAVAARYPWVDAYTPINEPLTTARFGALYGIWHPFRRDARSFARVFLQQCHAVRAAMQAVREVNSTAQLVQTEDIGKTHGTPVLAYQVDLENERRWLTFDLLGGRLTADQPMYGYLEGAGIPRDELDDFSQHPCEPGLLGMNHYVTSERMIDERLENYPAIYHGGNDRHAYADVPAVRVRTEGAAGPARLLRELWQRYGRPIALTEVQLACTRDEQLRWLQEMWQAALQLRREGADVRAVTAWTLFGAYDWDSLLLQAADHYEVGAYDVREGEPRATALAKAIRSLALTGRFDHPAARGAGWWRRPVRLTFPPVSAPADGPGTASEDANLSDSSLFIVGASSTVAAAFADTCELRGLAPVFAPGPPGADLDAIQPRGSSWGVNVSQWQTSGQDGENGAIAREQMSASVNATLDRLIDSY